MKGVMVMEEQSGRTTRKRHAAEFKRQALQLAEIKGTAAAARELGISESLLYSWKKRISADGPHAFRGNGKLKPEDDEMRRLRQENKRLALENEILKKATIFFANRAK
jgi:transposase